MKKIILCSGDPAGVGIELCLKLIESDFICSFKNSQKIQIDILGNIIFFQKCIELFYPSLKIVKEEKNYFIYDYNHQEKWKFLNVELPLGKRREKELEEKIEQLIQKTKKTNLKVNLEKKKFLQDLSKVSGLYSYQFLIKTTELLQKKKYHAVVTAPIHKERVCLQNKISFLGYTSFFKEKFQAPKCSMCFTSNLFDLVLITSHLPLEKVSNKINKENIILALENAVKLQKINGSQLPIAFMGINPHAGENGQIGQEDLLIQKEIDNFQKKNSSFKIEGPLPADSAFIKVAEKKYRTVICCYHDQGLIPLKMLSKFHAVNVSVGLPFVRTSPAHGTAEDIAWQNRCRPESFFDAIVKGIELLSLKN